MSVFNKTIIPLALVGYEMIIANLAGGIIVKYNPYRYLCTAPKSMVFAPFGLKKGIDFAHFGLESDMVFEGTIQECMNVYVVSIPSGYRREQYYANSHQFLRNFFVGVLI